jgi:TRAP-type uncharacterized transport system substrate-binding protein
MQREQWQIVAIGAGLVAVIIAIASGRMPRWLRAILVLGIVALSTGLGLYIYRYLNVPKTLTVAAGSFDGDAQAIMSAFAAQFAATKAPIRLNVLTVPTPVEAAQALADGKADLAIVRADNNNLADAQTIVVLSRGVVLLVAPPGSTATSMDDLKGKTIGVVGGGINHKVADALSHEYDPDHSQLHFKDLTLAEVPAALKSKSVAALLVVVPLTEKYLNLLRSIFPRNAKLHPTLIPIENAGAIAALTHYYQSYDLPKGTLLGSPAIPDDDLTTLHVPYYLVANNKMSEDVGASLAKAIMDTRRDLAGQYPLLSQVSAPDTDKTDSDNDTYLPVQAGANDYFTGNVQGFFDKYSNQIFYGSMLLGTLTSLFAAAWKFIITDENKPELQPLMRLHALTEKIRNASSEAELLAIEEQIDGILKGELEKYAVGKAEPGETAAMGLATQRLEHLVGQRRAVLANGKPAAASA